DTEFQNDCLAFSLFCGHNCTSSKLGTNHLIPFCEADVNACGCFDSHFMTDYIDGKNECEHRANELLGTPEGRMTALCFSQEAIAVFCAGRKLWQYYHAQPECDVNAGLYDIREYFQGRNDMGKMNKNSDDDKYNALIGGLRLALLVLAKKIEPRVYEYGFLRE
ncbi:MAG: hypothetical protein FWD57_16965, partial [Polyangiaceae bacterium]|nr:hypothetical protein [Polyangiaceae bacterium]